MSATHLTEEAKSERGLIAQKIVAIAPQGECNPALLRDRMLREVAYGEGGWATALVRAARRGRFEPEQLKQGRVRPTRAETTGRPESPTFSPSACHPA